MGFAIGENLEAIHASRALQMALDDVDRNPAQALKSDWRIEVKLNASH